MVIVHLVLAYEERGNTKPPGTIFADLVKVHGSNIVLGGLTFGKPRQLVRGTLVRFPLPAQDDPSKTKRFRKHSYCSRT